MSGKTFRVNSGGIVHETVDGEVIIIDLESGAYFSLTHSAADVWDVLLEGATPAELTAALAARYDAPAATVAAAVADFLDQLVAERILVADDGPAPARPEPPAAETKPPFVAPVLSKYTNMSDLLLLDPIHDVDEHGWPHKKPD